MATGTLETLIEREYETVRKEREDLLAKRTEIDQQLTALDRRLEAAANYKATLEGKFARPTQGARKPRAPSTGRAPRGARAELRGKIIALLQQHPEGLVANQITAAIPDKAVPNLLSLMKKQGDITQDAKRGPWYIPSGEAA